ncbi:hypothetical protein BLA29_014361 [Euroglyphus maynei]|uniref:Uncharacterized protein n=1 Tax=Euroglyphus maynei TaxID=6958 RepID=A0A1Y3BR87_EURMA|nr:hypothetical protein BLA29_014361 [Euroglyphus maynei]
MIPTSNHFHTQHESEQQPPLHYRSMLIDYPHQQQQEYSSTMATATLNRNHHHHHHHQQQQHSNHINHLRSGQSCPHVRCDIVEYL